MERTPKNVFLNNRERSFVAALTKVKLMPLAPAKKQYTIEPSQYVGVASSPDIQIIVHPKTKWISLFQMTMFTDRDDRMQYSDYPSAIGDDRSLIMPFVSLFLQSVETVVRQGIIREYQTETIVDRFVRGKIDFQKTLTRGLLIQGKFCMSVPCMNVNIAENQVILTCLKRIDAFVDDEAIRWKISELRARFHGVSLPENGERKRIESMKFRSLSKHYEKALRYARLLLLHLGLTLTPGNNPIRSFWINMDTLFQDFVLALTETCTSNYSVKPTRPEYIPEYTDPSRYVMIIPDITVLGRDNPILVVDAKWKFDSDNKDFYQAATYAHHLKTNALLVSPHDESTCKTDRFHVGNRAVFRSLIPVKWTTEDDFRHLIDGFRKVLENAISAQADE